MRWPSRFIVRHAEPRCVHHRPFRHARDAEVIVVKAIAKTTHFAMCRVKPVLLSEPAIAHAGDLDATVPGYR